MTKEEAKNYAEKAMEIFPDDIPLRDFVGVLWLLITACYGKDPEPACSCCRCGRDYDAEEWPSAWVCNRCI